MFFLLTFVILLFNLCNFLLEVRMVGISRIQEIKFRIVYFILSDSRFKFRSCNKQITMTI